MHISTGLLSGAISDLEVHLQNQGRLEKEHGLMTVVCTVTENLFQSLTVWI